MRIYMGHVRRGIGRQCERERQKIRFRQNLPCQVVPFSYIVISNKEQNSRSWILES